MDAPYRVTMRFSATSSTLALLLVALPVLSGCGDNSAQVVDVDVIGAETAPFESGVRLSAAGQLVRAATSEGLVALDEQGRVIPALADRWIVTDDGLSYIFRLRDGRWADGTEISGESARAALRQALAAVNGTTLALDLAGIAEIRAMAGRVIEVRLNRAMPDLLQVLAQPELGLQRRTRGSGPMTLHREGPLALLSPIPPGKLGLPEPADWKDTVRSIRLHSVPANVAVRRFGSGEVAVVLGGRFDSYPLARAAGGLSQRTVRLDPAPGLFGLVVARAGGLLAAPENREALALAIDRDALTAELGVGGWLSTTRIVAAGSTGDLGTIGERWADLPLTRRRGEAAARIARWHAQHPQPHGQQPGLRIALPAGPGADALFVRLSADFAAIGITLLRAAEKDADLRLIDAVARYARPEWYLDQLSCAAARGLCSSAADARLADARAASDPALHAALLAEAEAELTAANVYIPLGNPIRWSMVRDDVTGFAVNAQAFHPLLPLALRVR